jgi:putative ABC transport system ATP-binding protein
VTPGPGTDAPVLRVESLTKTYRSPDGEITPVLDVPSLELRAGEQVALRGSSGSGKTTLLHIIAGILTPDSGRVLIDGMDITALGEADRDALRAERIGYVFQTFNLLQGYSALENVLLGMMFGRGPDRSSAEALLTRVGLGARLGYLPRQLSVGQQQRVAVARALAGQPRLVLADEPTGNLDPRHGAEALTLIRDVCREQGAALLLVSHDPAVLAQFDRVDDLATLNRVLSAPAGVM